MMKLVHDKEMHQAALPVWARVVGMFTLLGFFYALMSDASILTSLTRLSRPTMLWSFGLTQVVIMVWQWSRIKRFIPAGEMKRQAKICFKISGWILMSIMLLVGLAILGLEIFGDTTANRQAASTSLYGSVTVIIVAAIIYVIWQTLRDFASRSK